MARAKVTTQELAPFAAGIGAILPAIFTEVAEGGRAGDVLRRGHPAHLDGVDGGHVHPHLEAHGIDAGVMRAAEGLARQAIGLGHGEEGFHRVAELLGRRS
ncbi:NAD(P)-dependent oxidoreductase OS=Streptomyces tendae OX=1932 GN=GUR47_25915 PE=3 SV=1 [Streptomyces tendae]